MLPVSDIERFRVHEEFVLHGVTVRVTAIDYRNKWLRLELK